ncbi:MAG: hypothetical protein N2512_05135, partial [Armatimonadetes bacterium]|nr:hypothetical protein [Armatimonadota bacterium]
MGANWLLLTFMLGWMCLALAGAGAGVSASGEAGLRVRWFQPVKPISRAGRPAGLLAVVENTTDADVQAEISLQLPARVKLLQGQRLVTLTIEPGDEAKLCWTVEARAATECGLTLEARAGVDAAPTRETLLMRFLAPMPLRKLPYIPAPEPVETSILVGAHNCPLWEADKPEMWANVVKHPERTPVLCFYDQANPEVADWETKWAVEHGVSFFVYCWYRASQGDPVKMRFGSAIHDALFRSRFVGNMKFAIMWE